MNVLCACFSGTGKTVVGVHIVYWFHKMNLEASNAKKTRETNEAEETKKTCILYCGPSNKSVDVVAGMLLCAVPALCKGWFIPLGDDRDQIKLWLQVSLRSPVLKSPSATVATLKYKPATMYLVPASGSFTHLWNQ